ncbi:hypothetical protein H5410_023620 [Solanum commersonii]|uniref:Uncharacterized protein n=1 Tax=Solanum commersonii TaxID=4109 RepID=A0A9J5ZHD7_SOLCO|nr:hypothetical protein H5410_023620 [Solanum commersonii]
MKHDELTRGRGVETSVGGQRVQSSRPKRSGDIDEMSHIASGCLDEMEVGLRVSGDKKIPSRLKAECWVKNAHVQKCMSRDEDVETDVWAHGSDKIRNRGYPEKVGVASVVDKPRKSRPRWFGHTGLGSPSPYRDMTLDRKECRGRVLRSRAAN